MIGVNSNTFTIDSERLEKEQENYESWLEERTESVYQIAKIAKSKNLDFENTIEIPRASDLASRTEKLLEDYLDGMKIEEELRHLLNTTDRESASIQIAVDVARRMNEETLDMQKSIDCGLRVGLAVLTEAVLVAPLDGIGDRISYPQHSPSPLLDSCQSWQSLTNQQAHGPHDLHGSSRRL